jgi:hypothetical protein
MALRRMPLTVVAPEPVATDDYIPSLLWPAIVVSDLGDRYVEQDRSQFPDEQAIRLRYQCVKSNTLAYGLKAFSLAVAEATYRIYILDLQFLEFGYAVLEQVMSATRAPEIRIVSKKATGQQRRELESKCQTLDLLRNPTPRDSRPPGKVEWRPDLLDHNFPHLHDRFAIIDNELWHFGATVGGGHPCLNAASRGWSATAMRATEFFNEVWRTL